MAARKNISTAGERLVKIRLPKERREQEDVFVGVNERTWLIKRGVEVEVPECVAEVLENREMMLEIIMDFEDAARAKN
jgi:hypothetical protein